MRNSKLYQYLSTHPLVSVPILFVFILIITLLAIPGKTTYKIDISTEEGAQIYIARQEEGEYKEIGSSRSTFESTDEGEVFIKVKNDTGESQGYVKFGQDNHPQSIHLPIEKMISQDKATVVFSGSVIDPLIAGSDVFGVASSSGSIINFNTLNQVPLKPEYIGIPYVSSIIWSDSNNFSYKTNRGGIGFFRDGEIKKSDTQEPLFIDFAEGKNGKIFLLAENGAVFETSNLGLDIKKVIENEVSGDPHIFADDKYLYYSDLPPHSLFEDAEEGRQDTENSENTVGSSIEVYSYQGEKLKDIPSKVTELLSVHTDNKGVGIVLDQRGATSFDDSTNYRRISYYFHDVLGSKVINDKLYILFKDGVWKFSPENEMFSKVFNFDNSTGIWQSLSKFHDSLLFGVRNQIDEETTYIVNPQ